MDTKPTNSVSNNLAFAASIAGTAILPGSTNIAPTILEYLINYVSAPTLMYATAAAVVSTGMTNAILLSQGNPALLQKEDLLQKTTELAKQHSDLNINKNQNFPLELSQLKQNTEIGINTDITHTIQPGLVNAAKIIMQGSPINIESGHHPENGIDITMEGLSGIEIQTANSITKSDATPEITENSRQL